MIHKVRNGDGVEIKTISLSTHVAVVFGVVAAASTVVAFFGGIALGSSKISDHANKEGHPVIIERVNTVCDDIAEIKASQRRIEKKLNE